MWFILRICLIAIWLLASITGCENKISKMKAFGVSSLSPPSLEVPLPPVKMSPTATKIAIRARMSAGEIWEPKIK